MTRSGSTPRPRLLADRAARWAVTAGGLGIIASILGILLFIVIEVVPVFFKARVEPGRRWSTAGAELGCMVTDEHRSHVAGLGLDGRVRVFRTADGAEMLERGVLPEGSPATLREVRTAPGREALTASTTDGRVLVVAVRWSVTFQEDRRLVSPAIAEPRSLTLDPAGRPLALFSAQVNEDGALAAAALLADGTIALVRQTQEEDFLSGEIETSESRTTFPAPPGVSVLLLDPEASNLYAGTEDGDLIWWSIDDGHAADPEIVPAGVGPITSLTFLIGHRSLVVGNASGSPSIWFPARQEDQSFRLTEVRRFPAQGSATRLLAPSMRGKGFLALGEDGDLGLYHSTSERVLWTGRSPLEDARALFYTPKADGAFLAGKEQLASLDIHNPHPEISLGALFGKVWYEGYPRAEYVWQSSGATDEFEPKLSLVPLLVGTLKGTFYSLFLAIPLGVLGAMYTSQFLHPRLRRVVKPTVEIMAALPSVVLGFLAGLWLAPRLEGAFPALLLMAVALPLLVMASGLAWRRLPSAVRGPFPEGSEVFLYAAVLCLGVWACIEMGGVLEDRILGGSFPQWLLDTTGLGYDQRNAVVVGLAMGFAVIPIIFAISEDAFSNVPRNLTSGSLALGATRWQTVTRVVLPTASPGIFSSVMVGFGRAVGETMIVLMATGNTPIMDWSPFNGFRTLSANIAVEIPEAPFGGTLYRTLFLAALLLFLLTFVVNTAAEVVRARLRRRYAEL